MYDIKFIKHYSKSSYATTCNILFYPGTAKLVQYKKRHILLKLQHTTKKFLFPKPIRSISIVLLLHDITDVNADYSNKSFLPELVPIKYTTAFGKLK